MLLSTLGQPQASGGTVLATHDAEIRFKHQSEYYASGYLITRVNLRFTGPANSAADLPSVALRNHIGAEAVLTGSATDLGNNTYAFTPPSPVRITSGPQYNIRIEGGPMTLAQTASNTVETGTRHEWYRFLRAYSRDHDSTGGTSSISGRSFMYSIRGRVVKPSATYIDNTGQTTAAHESMRGEDRAQPFTTGSDADGYTLHSVYLQTRDTSITQF